MHILIIPSWYKTPDNPVLGTFFEEQARMLLNKGYQVGILFPDHIMSIDLSQSHKKTQPLDFIDNGIPTYYSYTNSVIPRLRKINYWYACYQALKKYKTYTKLYGTPNIIHAHSTFIGGLVANAISKKYNIPYVLTEHYTGLIVRDYIWGDKTNKKLLETVFQQAKKVIIVSTFFKEELIKKYNISVENLEVIHNVVNPIFHETNIEKKKSNPFIILCVAFLLERKQHKLLFEAVEKLIQQGYNITLKLIGDGRYKNELMKDVELRGIKHVVIFMGNKTREVVKQELDNSHILVSASRFETFGVNLIEALACGRPVISIDSGGPRDIITKDNGILIKENSAQELVKAIKTMIENYDNYNQKNISNECVRKFSEDVIFEKLENIYKQIC